MVWNGGFEIDWKTIGAILAFVFLAGGGWYKLDAMERNFQDHIVATTTREHSVWSLNDNVQIINKRLDACCPFYPGPTPKDLAPPGRGGGQ